jgi:hypothetical protein
MANVIKKETGKKRNTEVQLLRSHLKGYEDKLFAQAVNNQTYNEEELCVLAAERGLYTGNVNDMKNSVDALLRVMVDVLQDGGRVTLGGLLSAKFSVHGWVEDEHAPIDPENNRLYLDLAALPAAREMFEGIHVVNKGLAPVQNYIAQIIDSATKEKNLYITKNGIFTLLGRLIKIVGDPALVGLFFISPGAPAVSVKLMTKLATNDPSKLVGIVPELAPNRDWYLEVRTFYSGGGAPLKELRTIRSKFAVRQL